MRRIIRVVLAEESMIGARQPHFDCLPHAICPLAQQFAACVYLNTLAHGGELEIWSVPPRTALEISGIDSGTDLRRMLPPSLLAPVSNGVLILFTARRPHCVRPFVEGERTSSHAFAGLTDAGRLVLWS